MFRSIAAHVLCLGLVPFMASSPATAAPSLEVQEAAQRLASAVDAAPERLGPLGRVGTAELSEAPQDGMQVLLPAFELALADGAVLQLGRARLALTPMGAGGGTISGTVPPAMMLTDAQGTLLGELTLASGAIGGEWQGARRGRLNLTADKGSLATAIPAGPHRLSFERLVLSLSLYAPPTTAAASDKSFATMDAELTWRIEGLEFDAPPPAQPLRIGNARGTLQLRGLAAEGTAGRMLTVGSGATDLSALLSGATLQAELGELQRGRPGTPGFTALRELHVDGGLSGLDRNGAMLGLDYRFTAADTAGAPQAAAVSATLSPLPQQLPWSAVLAELGAAASGWWRSDAALLPSIPAGAPPRAPILRLQQASLARGGTELRLSGDLLRQPEAAAGWTGTLDTQLRSLATDPATPLPADAMKAVLPPVVTVEAAADAPAAAQESGQLTLGDTALRYRPNARDIPPPPVVAVPPAEVAPSAPPAGAPPPAPHLRTLRVGP